MRTDADHFWSGDTDKFYVRVMLLKRRGYSANAITHLRRAYKTLYKSALTLEEAKQALALQVAECPEIGLLLDFLALSQRGIIR